VYARLRPSDGGAAGVTFIMQGGRDIRHGDILCLFATGGGLSGEKGEKVRNIAAW